MKEIVPTATVIETPVVGHRDVIDRPVSEYSGEVHEIGPRKRRPPERDPGT